MEFTPDSTLSLNPFSIIVDYKEQADLLIAVLIAMISPKGEVNEYQVAQLRKAVNALWHEAVAEHGEAAGARLNVDRLARTLREYRDDDGQLDRRVNDMGVQLFPFTSEGEYGKWFNRPATVSFTNPLNNRTYLATRTADANAYAPGPALLERAQRFADAFTADPSPTNRFLLENLVSAIEGGGYSAKVTITLLALILVGGFACAVFVFGQAAGDPKQRLPALLGIVTNVAASSWIAWLLTSG